MYDIGRFIDKVLSEDIDDIEKKIPSGDHTSLACIPKPKEGRAQLLCKANGILAGVELAEIVFARVAGAA